MSWNPLSGRARYADLWHDAERTILTLESFAETEADGARDIRTAAERTVDPFLREHFLRHAADEQRHAELFRDRARELRAEHPHVAVPERDARFDLAKGRDNDDLDAHGFFVAGLMDELGDVSYVAMLHVAEKRAEKLFRLQCDVTRHDHRTNAVFREILRDEMYHVSYTKTALDQWRKRGRGKEVSEALSSANGNRFLGAWRRLGVRAAGGFGQLVLLIVYWTAVPPFGLIARCSRVAGGFREPLFTDGKCRLRSQY